MFRDDFVVLFIWCAAVLALLFPVWSVPGAVFFNYGDLFSYHAPLRELTASELQSGHMPFWDPYILLGVPHLANPQTVLFYPLGLLSSLFPAAPALTWDTIFHLLWAGIGMFLLARAQKLGRGGAFVLASAFALSPFLIYRVAAGIPTLLAALSWIPWLWLAWLGAAGELLAAAFALQLLSGHGQFLVMNAAAMFFWGLFDVRRAVLLRRLFAAGAAALALTLAQGALTEQYLAQSVRGHWAGALSGLYAMPPAALWNWIHPGALGTPLNGRWKDAISVYFETCGGWIGPFGLVFAAVGLARGPRRWPGGALVVLGAALALGPRGPVSRTLLGFSFLSYLRTPSRWLEWSVWGAILLAGAGIKLLQVRRWPTGLRVAILAGAFATMAAWDHQFLRPQDPAPFLGANRALAEAQAGRPQRILTDPDLANPNKAILYRMMNVNGYEAFYPKDVPAWAAAAQGAVAADASRVFVSRWPSDWLARAGTRLQLTNRGAREAPAWPLATFRDASGARLAPDPGVWIESPGRWRVTGSIPPAATSVALALPRYPGWRAILEKHAEDIFTWDYVFSGVRLPARATIADPLDLSMEFHPTGWAALAALTAAAWLAWAAIFLRRVGEGF